MRRMGKFLALASVGVLAATAVWMFGPEIGSFVGELRYRFFSTDKSDAPLVIGFISDARDCYPMDTRLAPSKAEEPHFRSRLSDDRSTVIQPIEVVCAAAACPKADLARWAQAGDPVAIYASTYLAFKTTKLVCANRAEIERRLLPALKIAAPPYLVSRPIPRVPELNYVIAMVRLRCDQGDAEPFILSGRSGGYIPPDGIR